MASFAVAREFPALSLLAVMAVCPTLDKSEAEAKGRFSEPVATTDVARNTLFTSDGFAGATQIRLGRRPPKFGWRKAQGVRHGAMGASKR